MNKLNLFEFCIMFNLTKVLHLNLSIVNPLLQVIECGFKHGNNEIKSFTYECWKCLILNFALDRGYFFYFFVNIKTLQFKYIFSSLKNSFLKLKNST